MSLSAPARLAHGITIDPEGAIDLDDAIGLPFERGAQVFVANLADLLPMDVPDDAVARKRMFTRYHSAGKDSLFPFAVEKSASLLPGMKRMPFAITMRLDDNLDVAEAAVEVVPFRSRERLTYPQAGELIRDGKHKTLKALSELAQQLVQKRRNAGALAMYDVTRGFTLNEDGQLRRMPIGVPASAYILVQELMILANATMARYAVQHAIPVIFRAQRASELLHEREPMVREISAAYLSGDVSRLLTTSQRLDHLVGRAFYTAEAEGHWALNLPFYGPWTSPIRRFPDLVNWRQVLAFMRGEPYPYTREQLQEIAREATDAQTNRHDAQSAALRERQEMLAQRAGVTWQPVQLARLVDDEFERVVRVAPDDSPSDVLQQAIAIRAQNMSLPIKAAVQVLVREHEAWQPSRTAVLEMLASNPPRAVSLLAAASQLVDLERPLYVTSQDGPSHTPTITCMASTRHRGRTLTATAVAGTVKGAQQAAAVSLVRQLAGEDAPSVAVGPAGRPRTEQPGKKREKRFEFEAVEPYATAGNFVSALADLCSKAGVSLPAYGFEQTGPPHIPTITCRATVQVNGQRIEVQTARSSNKLAKQAAAGELYEALRAKYAETV